MCVHISCANTFYAMFYQQWQSGDCLYLKPLNNSAAICFLKEKPNFLLKVSLFSCFIFQIGFVLSCSLINGVCWVSVPFALTQKLFNKVRPGLPDRSPLKVIATFYFKVTVKLKPHTNHSNSSCNLLFNCNFSLGWPAVALHMDLRLWSWSLSSVSHTVRAALCARVCVEVEECSQILDNMLFCCLKALLLLGSKLECSTAKHASVVSNHHRNRLVTFMRSQEPLDAGQQNTGCHKGEWNSFETSYFVYRCVSLCSFRSPEGNSSLDTLNVFSLSAKPLLDSPNLALATNFEFPWTVVIMLSGICISSLFFSASYRLSFRCAHVCCRRGVLQVFWGRRRACRMNQRFIKQQPNQRREDEMRWEASRKGEKRQGEMKESGMQVCKAFGSWLLHLH